MNALVGDPRQSHIAKIFPREIALNLVRAAKAEINREEAVDAAILEAKIKCPELFRLKALPTEEEKYEMLHGKKEPARKTTASQTQAIDTKARARYHDGLVLEAIFNLGHNPKSLPTVKLGAKGIKSKLRKELESIIPGAQFDYAWQRLADKKKIAYGKGQ